MKIKVYNMEMKVDATTVANMAVGGEVGVGDERVVPDIQPPPHPMMRDGDRVHRPPIGPQAAAAPHAPPAPPQKHHRQREDLQDDAANRNLRHVGAVMRDAPAAVGGGADAGNVDGDDEEDMNGNMGVCNDYHYNYINNQLTTLNHDNHLPYNNHHNQHQGHGGVSRDGEMYYDYCSDVTCDDDNAVDDVCSCCSDGNDEEDDVMSIEFGGSCVELPEMYDWHTPLTPDSLSSTSTSGGGGGRARGGRSCAIDMDNASLYTHMSDDEHSEAAMYITPPSDLYPDNYPLSNPITRDVCTKDTAVAMDGTVTIAMPGDNHGYWYSSWWNRSIRYCKKLLRKLTHLMGVMCWYGQFLQEKKLKKKEDAESGYHTGDSLLQHRVNAAAKNKTTPTKSAHPHPTSSPAHAASAPEPATPAAPPRPKGWAPSKSISPPGGAVRKEPSNRTLNRQELAVRIEAFNKNQHGLPMTLTEDQCGRNEDTCPCYQGFIRVYMQLTRPISMVLPSKAPSLTNLTGDALIGSTASLDRSSLEETGEITSFYLPKDTTKAIHINSETSAHEVIKILLTKFYITDNPHKFALYEKVTNSQSEVTMKRLSDTDEPLPLCLSWTAEGLNNHQFVLQDNDTEEVMWDAFSTPELETFLRILSREENEYLEQVRSKYQLLRIQMNRRLEELRAEKKVLLQAMDATDGGLNESHS